MRTREPSTKTRRGNSARFFLCVLLGVSGMLTCVNGKNGMASRFRREGL